MRRLTLIKRVLCTFLAAAFAVSTVGCTKKDSSKDTKNMSRQIQNYFIPKELDLPEGLDYVDSVKYASDKIYLSGYKNSGGAGQNITKLLDVQNKSVSELKTKSDISYMTAVQMTADKIYMSYSDADSNQCIAAADRATGEEIAKADLNQDEFILSMFVGADGNLRTLKIKYKLNTSTASLQVYDSSFNVLEETDLSQKLGLDKDMMISAITPDKEGGYFAVAMNYASDDGQSIVYKLSSSFDVIYTIDDMSDLSGYINECIVSANGNLIVCAQDYEAGCILANEINAQDGSVVNRYEIKGAQGCYGQAGEYDVVYSDGISVYGYKFENQQTEKIIDFGDELTEDFGYATTATEGNTILMNTSSYGVDSGQTYFIMDLDGKLIKEINLSENIEQGGYVNQAYVNSNGILYALETVSEPAEDEETGDYSQNNKYGVMIYDENGDYTETIELDDLDISSDAYVQNITVKDDGTMILAAQEYSEDESKAVLCVVDPDGKLKSKIDTGDIQYIDTMIVTDTADYVVSNDEEMQITPIDYENNKLAESIELDKSQMGNYGQVYDGEGSYDFYYANSDSVYGYSIKDKKATEIINWIDSDISLAVQGFYPSDDDTIVCSAYDRKDGNSQIYILKRADEETLKKIQNKQIITAAGMDVVYSKQADLINDFNKNNDEFRIQLTDYSKYSTYKDDKYESGAKQLNNDIIAGKVPDIIIGNAEIDMESYTAKGLLADLNQYINNDSDIKKDDYYTNIFDIYTTDDKMFQLIPQFTAGSVIGKASELGDTSGWTMDDFLKFADSKDKVFYDTSYDDMLSLLVKANLNEFVDFSKKTCDFDNENFVKLLEFIKKDGIKESKHNNYKNSYSDDADQDFVGRFKNNKCFAEKIDMSSFEDYNILQQGYIGEEAVLKGIPMSEGNGTLIVPGVSIGIAEKSKNKDAAWSFVKNFLLDDYQDGINEDYTCAFPLKKSSMDNVLKNAQNSETGSSYVPGTDGQDIEIKPIDSESAQKLIDTITSASRHSVNDTRINDIIDEQFNAFIENGTTAEEAAKAIQSKAALYLKEIS